MSLANNCLKYSTVFMLVYTMVNCNMVWQRPAPNISREMCMRTANLLGCIQSVDWTGGLDYWTDLFTSETLI